MSQGQKKKTTFYVSFSLKLNSLACPGTPRLFGFVSFEIDICKNTVHECKVARTNGERSKYTER